MLTRYKKDNGNRLKYISRNKTLGNTRNSSDSEKKKESLVWVNFPLLIKDAAQQNLSKKNKEVKNMDTTQNEEDRLGDKGKFICKETQLWKEIYTKR